MRLFFIHFPISSRLDSSRRRKSVLHVLLVFPFYADLDFQTVFILVFTTPGFHPLCVRARPLTSTSSSGASSFIPSSDRFRLSLLLLASFSSSPEDGHKVCPRFQKFRCSVLFCWSGSDANNPFLFVPELHVHFSVVPLRQGRPTGRPLVFLLGKGQGGRKG